MSSRLNLPKNAGVIGPFIGVSILVITVAVLVIQMTIRPWATPDYGSETHLNMERDLDGYTRTRMTYLDTETESPAGWVPSEDARAVGDGFASFVGYGCASCHGLDASGTSAGPSVAGSSERRLENMLNNGPKGMPAYEENHLLTADRELIAAYLGSLPQATPTPAPILRATATPYPQPTVPSTDSDGSAETPVSTPVAEAPTPLPTEPPVAVDSARLESSQRLFFDVGCDICHGQLAEGGSDGPGLDDLTAEEIRDFVRNPVRPADSSFSEGMDPYDVGSLSEDELDEIIFFLLNKSN